METDILRQLMKTDATLLALMLGLRCRIMLSHQGSPRQHMHLCMFALFLCIIVNCIISVSNKYLLSLNLRWGSVTGVLQRA